MTFDLFWTLVSNTAGGPSPVMRERYFDEARRFFEGRTDKPMLEIAWTPTVRATNARGEGEWTGCGFVWLRLSRHPNDEITAAVRLETDRGGTPDPDRLAVFAQTCAEVSVLLRNLKELL